MTAVYVALAIAVVTFVVIAALSYLDRNHKGGDGS